MAGTVTLKESPFTGSVWERTLTYVLTTTSGGDEITLHVPISGILTSVICKVGEAAGITGTLTLAIDDNNDNEIFTVASLAESTTYSYEMYKTIYGGLTVGVNPSDDPTSSTWTITVTLRGLA